MTPFDNSAFGSWPLLLAGAFTFGILFETPVILYDLVVEGAIVMSPAAILLGLAGFGGYLGMGAAIKAYSADSD